MSHALFDVILDDHESEQVRPDISNLKIPAASRLLNEMSRDFFLVTVAGQEIEPVMPDRIRTLDAANPRTPPCSKESRSTPEVLSRR